MAATKSAQNPTQDWQQYWDTWFQGQRVFFDKHIQSSTQMQSQWSEFFKEWQNNVSPTQPNAGVYQQFFAQAGQQYLDMMQQFYQATGQNKPVTEAAGEWLTTLQQFFLSMLQTNTQPFDVQAAYKNVTEAVAKGTQAWTQAFQQGGPFGQQGWGAPGFGFSPQGWNMQGFGQQNPWGNMGGNAFGGFNPSAWGAAKPQNFDIFGFAASLPGIGYTREKQEELNDLYNLWTAFSQEVRKYNGVMAQVGLEAVHKFQEYVGNPPAEAAPLTSLKEIYAKWVDICEDVYAKYAMSEEYTKLYGEVVNALMSYKAQVNKITDGMMGQLNLPTRTEVDSLHQRMHTLRRDNLELRKLINELRGEKGKTRPSQPAQSKSSKKGGKK